jgi:serine/threonine-protein kinase
LTDPFEQLKQAMAGQYRLERELGRGGMAVVYLAHDLKHDRPVALKVLLPELAASLGPERFLREIQLAARLQHPHILTVLDSGNVAGQLWFTMPYVEGESLRDRLRRERQLPIDDAVQIAREAARALDYAHQHGVVHRDIKPENILLTRDGSTLVADFGIARALAAEEQLTQTGMTVGTPAYMSPEQAAGDPTVDGRSDIYSLGCTLYEMLAGEPPFTGPTAQAVLMRRFTDTPRPLHEARETVPPAVEQVVTRALARAPADRFASAGQLAQALQPSMATPTAVRTVSTPATAGPTAPTAVAGTGAAPARRRRVPVAAVSLGLGFLIGLGVLFAWHQSRPAEASATGVRRIAVLPFENVGNVDDAYFADGVSDAVRGKLAAIRGLEVTARSSAEQYRKGQKPMQVVGRELGVDYVLTGTVRWAKAADGTSRVEVSPELVDVAPGHTPSTRWQQPFVASMSDVFQVQADIATRVASALDVAIGDSTKQQLAERPTKSLPAYDAYLRGRSYEQRARLNVERQTMYIARQMYERAIHEDSTFGLAWAGLAQADIYIFQGDRADTAVQSRARAAAERAVALAPTAAEARIALSAYYRIVTGDPTRAEEALEAAVKLDGKNPELLQSWAWSQWERGRRDSAVATIRRAMALDPRSAPRALAGGDILASVGRYEEATAAFDRAIALAPDQYHAYWDKAQALIGWKGDVEGARRTMQEAEARIGKVEFVRKMCVACFDWAGPLAADYERILDQLSLDGFTARDSANYYGARTQRAYMRHDAARVRIYGDSARVLAERFVKVNPTDPWFHQRLAFTYAMLGRLEDAVREYHRYADLRREKGDTNWLRTESALDLGTFLAMNGKVDAGIDSIRVMLSDTSYHYVSRAALRVDPFWGAHLDNPRLRGLIEGS